MLSRFLVWVSKPDPANGISVEGRVGADNWKALDLALGGHQAVKWVSMMKGHRHDRSYMRQLSGEHLDLVQLKLAGYELVERLRQGEFAQADLDRYLPQTGHAQQAAVPGILNQRLRVAAETGIVGDEPKERVRVQQQVHFM
jgi:hypothetical protein